MKKLAVLTALLTSVVVASPVEASVNREIATYKDTGGAAAGYLRAYRFNPDANYQTWVSACCYVPDISKPQFSVGRPTSDLYAAGQAAKHYWPGCTAEWYAAVDHRSTTGFYYTFYRITC